MTYPRLSGAATRLFVDKIDPTRGIPEDVWCEDFLENHASEGRSTEDISPILTRLSGIDQEWSAPGMREGLEPDKAEARLVQRVHNVLAPLPIEVLDDEGLWQFLAVRYFREFILWREHKALEKGNIGTYFLAKRNTEQIPLRIFLRGQIAHQDGDYRLAGGDERDTDLWRSHLIRVSTGYHGDLARTFLRSHVERRMMTPELRSFAKRLNRHWANRDLYLLDHSDCTRLVAEERAAGDTGQTDPEKAGIAS